MTDKKMADEWVDKNGFGSDYNNIDSFEANREMGNAFLAGLEGGRKMIDEEMAEEYAKPWKTSLAYVSVKEAYLAGLKAGRPKWHDLRKDPNDVPFQEKNKKWHIVLDNFGNKCFYDNIINKWRRLETLDIIEPTAWCEIPKYTEE